MIRLIFTRGEDGPPTEASADKLPALLADPAVFLWADLSAPTTPAEVAILRDVFKFHTLAVEDCFEDRTHPKIEEYEGYLYLVTHGLSADSTAESADPVELDAFVNARSLVTHHAQPSRSIAAVMETVLKTGLPLHRGPVGVLHAILDRQVEGLEEVLDDVEERITGLEDAVFQRQSNTRIASLLALKRNILQLRRWMSKQREVLLRLGRREFPLISSGDAMLFRDVYDHLVRINDLLENFREMLTSIQEAYLAVTSNRLNEVMKFLTLFTAVLMPLTVITGIYGMNFQHMPELGSRWGYPLILSIMAATSGSVLLYFRRRGWLGSNDLDPRAGGEPDASYDRAPSRLTARRTSRQRAVVRQKDSDGGSHDGSHDPPHDGADARPAAHPRRD